MTLKTIFTVAVIALGIAKAKKKFPKKPQGPLLNDAIYPEERR